MGSLGPVATPPERIDLSGSPHEIGVQHGRQLAAKIRSQIVVYDAMFQTNTKMDWDAVRKVSQDYAKTIQRLTPEIYTEMEGIAEGANLDILDVVALNSRSEIALGMFSDGCSSTGWDRKDLGVLLAQNWDWTARVKNNCVMMSIDQPNKPKIWMVTEAGIVGKIGFNSASVATCMNAIRAKPVDSSKIPVHIALRVCLESTSKKEAIDRIKSLGGIASAQHILLADTEGPVSLELTPKGDTHILPDEDGIVCHTNHLIENRDVHEPPWLSGSPIRLDRIRKLMKQVATTEKYVDGDILRRRVFSDTYNAPQAICCQEDPSRPIASRSSTLFCIVMKLGACNDLPQAEVVWGQPGSGREGDVLHMPW
ncbi:hypothetical protein PMZ80_005059 [Knufia obscura]|uniref:Peptidase C45 hydrolase domain-containing protein n=1 Tax=Knufia obscura TaxID=1635080 RepID=A0ABR0RPJ2_9EURO|nr:hypothetical protein PMZ80_005059 [Knufia obscura]